MPWTVVDTAVSPTSGAALVDVAGAVHLFALGAKAELRHSTFSPAGWRSWEFLDGNCVGTPSASSWGPMRIDTAARCADQGVWSRPYDTSTWLGWASLGGQVGPILASADPVVLDLGGRENRFFVRDPSGKLLTTWYNSGWLNQWLDTGIVAGENLTGVARTSGSYDIFFFSEGTEVTHVWWPR